VQLQPSQPPPGYPYYPPPQPQHVIVQVGNNGLAIASAVIGIASWVLCPFIGALVAILMGHIALSEIKHNPRPGRGWALVGVITGYAHLAVYGFALVIIFALCGGLAVFVNGQPQPSP
jgi:hypothetical protein